MDQVNADRGDCAIAVRSGGGLLAVAETPAGTDADSEQTLKSVAVLLRWLADALAWIVAE